MYAEKSKSQLRFFKESVVDTAAINFWLQHANPLWSIDQALGKIVEKQNTAKDIASLKIRVNRHFKFGTAGQHHPVFVEINGRRYQRTYSLSQIDAQHVLLTLKKVESGKVSSWLFDQAKVGEVLSFGEPYGEMQIQEAAEQVVLLAAGSGITPMYSLLKYWSGNKHLLAKPVTLLYWVKTLEEAVFQQEFLEWSKQYPKFKFKLLCTQTSTPDARINQSDAEAIEHLTNSVVYACGPSGFVASAEKVFDQARHFYGEAFSISPVQSEAQGFVKITLTKSNQVLNIPKGQAILPSLEQQNIKPTFGCRMGICNKCVCHKAEGATKHLINGLENTEPNAQLKICVNSAQSDLVIDL